MFNCSKKETHQPNGAFKKMCRRLKGTYKLQTYGVVLACTIAPLWCCSLLKCFLLCMCWLYSFPCYCLGVNDTRFYSRCLPDSPLASRGVGNLRRIACMLLLRNKEEIALDLLKEANVVVFGCPREKFSSSEVTFDRVL